MEKVLAWILALVLFAALFAAISAGVGWVFWGLWNVLLAPPFALKMLSFTQSWGIAVALMILSGIFIPHNGKKD